MMSKLMQRRAGKRIADQTTGLYTWRACDQAIDHQDPAAPHRTKRTTDQTTGFYTWRAAVTRWITKIRQRRTDKRITDQTTGFYTWRAAITR